MKPRILIAMVLSMAVLLGWPIIYNYFWPQPTPTRPPVTQPANPSEQQAANNQQQTAPPAQQVVTPPAKTPAKTELPSAVGETKADPRAIVIKTPFYRVELSNTGAIVRSWELNAYKDNGEIREIRGADNGPLQLIPREIPPAAAVPFSLRLPGSPDLEPTLNSKNFTVEGASENEIILNPGERRTITFRYSSNAVSATKTFEFNGDHMYADVKAEVVKQENQQQLPQQVQLVLGPRIGDQSDAQTSSYSTPSQIVSYTIDGSREYALATGITQPFAAIREVRPAEKQIVIDKDPQGALDHIKIVADKGATFIGYARVAGAAVKEGDDRFVLTLAALPENVQPGMGVARAVETLAKGYRWVGITDHYFAMVAVPEQPIGEIALTNLQVKASDSTVLDYPAVAVPVSPVTTTHIFVGPKDKDLLASVGQNLNTDLGALIDYGFFGFLVRPLIPVLSFSLDFFAKLFNNYGWAIVAVTMLINLALSPLRFASSKKMKKAAKYQPRIKELQEKMKKLKENPKRHESEIRKVQEEQVALMREANPLGGCLPLLLQLPIFWAVYLYLQSSLDVRHAPWLYIRDLSRPDPTYILPIVMCVTMIASTKLTPQPAQADPSMKMQRIMMTWLMPIMLTYFFFFSAPSGLVLYWMVSNLVGVAIQLWINKRTAEPAVEEAATGGKSGGKGDKRSDGKANAAKRGKEIERAGSGAALKPRGSK